ncbi:hypothetical protein I7I53_10853 [Histoplasma capsulatum var. duboisii H88]|uniref:Secreted protein n=1 Tax=Ajellomyces capsulatus (strain H88) TaxID=544711 RepID=A0A8A1LBM1_AJEC8|nr:hypothetical protein I7I53_10853 [Histoplasma capsulatum var. duboisii H88]
MLFTFLNFPRLREAQGSSNPILFLSLIWLCAGSWHASSPGENNIHKKCTPNWTFHVLKNRLSILGNRFHQADQLNAVDWCQMPDSPNRMDATSHAKHGSTPGRG